MFLLQLIFACFYYFFSNTDASIYTGFPSSSKKNPLISTINILWSRGYLTVFRLRGSAVRFHWTTPLCAVLAGRFEFVPALWLGYLLLVLVHELGHAFVVWQRGLEVESIDVHGVGGLCRWSGDAGAYTRALIAWGGVWAQAAGLALAFGASLVWGPPAPGGFWAQLFYVFTTVNLWLMALNLIPVPPLDGVEAWKLIPMVWSRRKKRKAPKSVPPITKHLVVPREVHIREANILKEEQALSELDEIDPALSPDVEALLNRVREISAREAERVRQLRHEQRELEQKDEVDKDGGETKKV